MEWLIYPSAFLCGLAAPLLWCSMRCYVTHISTLDAQLTNENVSKRKSFYFSIFSAIMSMTFIVGNVVTVAITTDEISNITIATNYTNKLSQCGLYYEESGSFKGSKELSESLFYLLLGVFLGMQGLGAVMLFFVKKPEVKVSDEENIDSFEGLKFINKCYNLPVKKYFSRLSSKYSFSIKPFTIAFCFD